MRRARLGRALGGAALIAAALVTLPRVAAAQEAGLAPAAGRPAVILPTVVSPRAEKAAPQDERELQALARSLDALLTDSAQDLGLAVDLGRRRPQTKVAERDLPGEAEAASAVVVLPSLTPVGDAVEVRLVWAEHGSKVLHVRMERAQKDDVAVRAAVMLRDLAREATRGAASPGEPLPAFKGRLATRARSAGRITLAVNATVFGGFIGFSVLRSSGSEDPRLLYPLLAVGAGVGLGSSLIAADEWDVGLGDAWFLSAAALWPSAAGHLIWQGRFADDAPADERWTFGLVGGLAGLTLGTIGLAGGGIGEGGAAVAHSGGGLGLIFGGLTELFADGDVYEKPFAGMGYGAGIGWLAAAAIATKIHVAPGRVLAVDLGSILGGLGGAALASPLLFDAPSPSRQRGWLGATAGAALLGAGVAIYATSEPDKRAAGGDEEPAPRGRGAKDRAPSVLAYGRPAVGVLGSTSAMGRSAPIVGLGWTGELE